MPAPIAKRSALKYLPVWTVKSTTGDGKRQASQLIEDLVDRYEFNTGARTGALRKKALALRATILETGEQGLEAVLPHVRELETIIQQWSVAMRPVLINARARGAAHDAGEHLAEALRSLGARLFNEFEMLDLADRLVRLCRAHFADLPAFMEEVEADEKTIQNLFAQCSAQRPAPAASAAQRQPTQQRTTASATAGHTKSAWNEPNRGPPPKVEPKSKFQQLMIVAAVVIAFFVEIAIMTESKLPGMALPEPVAAAPAAVAGPADPRMPFLPLPPPTPEITNVISTVLESAYKGDAAKTAEGQQLLASSVKKTLDKAAIKSARAANTRGVKAMEAAEYVVAANAFHDGLVLAPDDVEINDNLAYALYMAGKYTDALNAAAATALLAPKRANAWATMGNAMAASGKQQPAIGAWLIAHKDSRAPKKTREAFVKGAVLNPVPPVRAALRLVVNRITQDLTPAALTAALPRLPLEFGLYLPTVAQPTTLLGAAETFVLLNNAVQKPTGEDTGYMLLFGPDNNCVESACLNGAVSARRDSGDMPPRRSSHACRRRQGDVPAGG